MKRLTVNSLYGFLIVGLFLSTVTPAFADITQLDNATASDVTDGPGSTVIVQELGTGLTGSFGAGSFYVERVSGSGTMVLGVRIWECTTPDSGGRAAEFEANTTPTDCSDVRFWEMFPINTSKELVTDSATNGAPYAANPDYYYYLLFTDSGGDASTWKVYGSAAGTWPDGTCFTDYCGSLADVYFNITGIEADSGPDPDGDTATHVIRVNAPELYEVTASTTIDVNFDWQQGSTTTNVYSLQFVNTLSYQSLYVPWDWLDEGTEEGTFTQSTSVTLPAGGTWKMGVLIGDGGLDDPSYPTTYIDALDGHIFSAVFEDNVSHPVFGPAYQEFSAESCQLDWDLDFNVSDCVGYLLIPGQNMFSPYAALRDTLATKFPFSYFFSMADTWQALTATGGTLGAVSFDYADSGIGSTTPMGNILPNVEVFSQATITTYLPDEILDVFKLLMSAVLWLGLFGYIFRDVRQVLSSRRQV